MQQTTRAATRTHGVQAIVHIGKCEKKARLLGKVCTAPKTIEDVIRSAQKAQVSAAHCGQSALLTHSLTSATARLVPLQQPNS